MCIRDSFCTSPGWVISQQATSGEVIGIPEQLQAKQISDHAAACATLVQRPPTPESSRPIPKA
eukprot:3345204-Pyramimonas_sp.AAC.1